MLVLLVIACMQVLPFIPTHMNCEDACCASAKNCCQPEASTGCEMAMTSCSIILFLPLVSAPLIKVETAMQDLKASLTVQADPLMMGELQSITHDPLPILKAPPPGNFPLLI